MAGKREPDVRPVPVRRDSHGAAVCLRDCLDDREAEPAATACASVVTAGEALERARRDLGREPLALVEDVDLDRVADIPRRDGDSSFAVSQRVVDEVPQCLLEPKPVGGDLGARRNLDVDPPVVGRGTLGEALGRGASERTEVDGLDPQPERLLVGAGDEEEILGEDDKPVGLLGGRSDR